MSLIFWMLRLFSYFWLQESEFPNREPGTAMNENPHSGMQTVRPGSFLGFRNASGMGEPAHTLQQIWFSKDTRNDSISLMSAIFADCRQDFYTLLSTHERCPKEPSSINGLCANSSCSNHKAAFKQKEAPNAQSNKEAGEAIAFKFHNAVANVSLLLLIHVSSLLIALDLWACICFLGP